MKELKDSLDGFDGMAAAISLNSKHKELEMPIEKPNDWDKMTIFQQKSFIVRSFLERDLITVKIQGINLF